MAALEILSCCLTFNLCIYLGISLTRVLYLFSQKGEARIALTNHLTTNTSDAKQLIKIPFLTFIAFYFTWYLSSSNFPVKIVFEVKAISTNFFIL